MYQLVFLLSSIQKSNKFPPEFHLVNILNDKVSELVGGDGRGGTHTRSGEVADFVIKSIRIY